MSSYIEQMRARRALPIIHRTLAPAGEQVIAEISCPSGGKYYLLSCERDCGATVCHRCGKPARSTALYPQDLLERFGWGTPLKTAAELIRFARIFNVQCKNYSFPAGSSHFPADVAPVGATSGEMVLRPREKGSSAHGRKTAKLKTAPTGANGGAQ